ncbi:hypothetical protein [Pedobacter hartonius]|uniref:Uncharacterized protein n=1 Tax=Pedobacter hartonius TaxID=425514 RepID=A0A1H4CCW8_9SPHI|nr:hypothetical protein [Pedobacter hartonius]SEA58226.1 hypothetical protein SAMN05443550_1041 [Pedobacter hartonius]
MTKNTSSLPSEQKGITTTPYSLKEQAAIDAINSKYTYEEVTFFLEVIHDILTDHRLCPLLRVSITVILGQRKRMIAGQSLR